MSERTADTLIVGGGLAGCCAAIRLARAGLQAILVERSAGPHDKVCGEFLSGEALAELDDLGVDLVTLGALPMDRVRIAARCGAAPAPLPFPALSLTRRALDEALLAAAADAGATVRRGVSVTRTERRSDGWNAALSDGDAIRARALVVATGKHDLRGDPRPEGIHADLVGLKAYYRLTDYAAADLSRSVDVVFFPGGYCGFQLVETGEANACLVVSREVLAELGGDPWAVFGHVAASCEHAARLLSGAAPAIAKPLAIGRVPYGYVRSRTDGPYHVGDQAAVIPSFCGEGMGIALRSGRLAAEAILAGRGAAAYQGAFARLAGPRVRTTARLSRALSRALPQAAAVGLTAVAPRLVTTLAAATRTPQSSSA